MTDLKITKRLSYGQTELIYHCAMNLRAARLACRASRREHDYHPLIVAFQWLPVERRIEYKLATSWYNVITCTAPPYLSDPSLLYTPSRTLRSLADFFFFPRSVFWSDARSSKDGASFLLLVLPSGRLFFPAQYSDQLQEVPKTAHPFFYWCFYLEDSPFLCATFSDFVCLQVVPQGSSFLCLTPNTSNCLQRTWSQSVSVL